MPLKLFRRGQTFYLRGTVRGLRCYETTGTSDPALAEACRAKREAELYEQSLFGQRASVSFNRAALSYLEQEPRGHGQQAHAFRLADHFGARLVATIGQAEADAAVAAILRPDAAPATKRRNVLGPLTAVLNHAARRGWCQRPDFELPRVPRGRTRWLTPAEALALEDAAAPHLKPLIRFCLCTGARLSEALYLDWAEVDLAGARVIFHPDRTKANRLRAAGLPPAAIAALAALSHRQGPVFLTPGTKARRGRPGRPGAPYADRQGIGGGQIKTAWRTACRKAGIEGATPHTMRHTWATWFYAAARDPLLLRDEGGWAGVALVERYAHLMPRALVPEIARVWGPTHPRLPAEALDDTVQNPCRPARRA